MRFLLHTLIVIFCCRAFSSKNAMGEDDQTFFKLEKICDSEPCECGDEEGKVFHCPQGMYCARLEGFGPAKRCTNMTGLVIAPPSCHNSQPAEVISTPSDHNFSTENTPPMPNKPMHQEPSGDTDDQILPHFKSLWDRSTFFKLILAWPYIVFAILLLFFAVGYGCLCFFLHSMEYKYYEDIKNHKKGNRKAVKFMKNLKIELAADMRTFQTQISHLQLLLETLRRPAEAPEISQNNGRPKGPPPIPPVRKSLISNGQIANSTRTQSNNPSTSNDSQLKKVRFDNTLNAHLANFKLERQAARDAAYEKYYKNSFEPDFLTSDSDDSESSQDFCDAENDMETETDMYMLGDYRRRYVPKRFRHRQRFPLLRRHIDPETIPLSNFSV